MKNKILILIIGILIGALLASGCWYFYTKSKINNNGGMQPPSGQMGDMGNGQMGNPPSGNMTFDNQTTPPSKPEGNMVGDNQGNPPEKPEDNGNMVKPNEDSSTTESNS